MKIKISIVVSMIGVCMQAQNSVKPLQEAPATIEFFNEIATQYNAQLPELWNSLTPEERVFVYYMFRASIPGNRIMADQTHRHAVEIIELFLNIIEHTSQLDNQEDFLRDAQLYLVYVLAHHGQYFLREFENHKRTPAKLNLTHITPDSLLAVLTALGVPDAQELLARLNSSLFDATAEPTVTVEGSIEKSAGNIYSHDFTQADFDALSPDLKSTINAYFYVDTSDGTRKPVAEKYKIGGKYSQELQVAHHWLAKARGHAQQHPAVFDAHIPASLGHLLTYLETGDEEYFKKFSIEWLKTHSRIDFNFGFVEVYHDPMQSRGSFEADVTIKAIDMKKLNQLLPALEQELPFPEEFKRQNLNDTAAIPNASINAKLFASGEAGPVKITAAYCLPNYNDIRAQYGSKQIIYQMGKGLGQLIQPELALRLFNLQEHVTWLQAHDPQMQLDHDIWDVHVALHETLGHGSGRDAQHVFVAGDPLTIGGKQYALGDTILVTSDNATEFIGGYMSALEELRAEIIALYTSVYNFDVLAASGLYKEWPAKIGKEKLIELFILHMATSGLQRLVVQADNAVEIVQAHARADTAILNYLLDHGSLELVEETYLVNGTDHTVIGLRVRDLAQAVRAVKDLACEVQRCKSTADGQGVAKLMKTYGTVVRHPEYITMLKANRQAMQGELKEVAEIFPRFVPVLEGQTMVDVSAEWPAGFLEQQLELNKLMLSTKLS